MRVRFYTRKYKRSPYRYYKLVADGQVVQDWKSTGKKLKREAEDFARRQALAFEASPHAVTLDEAFEELARHKERKEVSDATMEILSLKASHVRTFFGPSRDVRTITLDDTERYLEHRRQTVGDSTIAKEMRELTAALRRLKTKGKYGGDPGHLWPSELAHSFPGRTRWLPWDEYLAVLGAMHPPWRDHFVGYCHTGVRLRELYRIHASDLDGDQVRVRGTKTEAAVRTIALSPDAVEMLHRRALAAPQGPLFPITSPNWDDQGAAWWKALTAACERAGVRHASTNDLRRTFCTWGRDRGVDLDVMVKWMGHKSLKMILEVYGQLGEERARREAAKMPSRRSHPKVTPNRAAPRK